MMPPSGANPKGYFEPQKIVGLHDDMLSALKSSWIDIRHLDLSGRGPTAAAEFKDRLTATVDDEYGDSSIFVVKDPRICRFFPLWREIADTVGAETRVIMVIRNPIEVARSLGVRDGLSMDYCLNLWLRHVLDAELESRHCKRVFVNYADFLNGWIKIIEQVEDRLDIQLSARTPDVQAAVEAFIDREMRHHTIDNKTLELECSGHPLIAEAYGALERLTKQSDDQAAKSVLDHVRESFDGAMRILGDGFCADLFSVQAKLYSATSRIAELENHVSDFNSLAENLDSAQWTVQKLKDTLAERTNEIAALNSSLVGSAGEK